MILTFLLWTLLLYIIHRVIHVHGRRWFPVSFKAHSDHHKYINTTGGTQWHWNNCFLFNDTWLSTLDLWITEVVPTLMGKKNEDGTISAKPLEDMYPFLSRKEFYDNMIIETLD